MNDLAEAANKNKKEINDLLKSIDKSLKQIDKRQKSENKWSLVVTVSTFLVMAGLGYLAIHLEVFSKDEVRQFLINTFNAIFG